MATIFTVEEVEEDTTVEVVVHTAGVLGDLVTAI